MNWKFIGYRESGGGIVAEFAATLSKDELAGTIAMSRGINAIGDAVDVLKNWPKPPPPPPPFIRREVDLADLVGEEFVRVGIEEAGHSDDDFWRVVFNPRERRADDR